MPDRADALMIEDDDVRQITERFELRKVGAGETATEGHNVEVSSGAQDAAKTDAGSPSAAP